MAAVDVEMAGAAPLKAGGAPPGAASQRGGGLRAYYSSKLDELELVIRERTMNMRRLEAQRNALNTKGAWGRSGAACRRRGRRPQRAGAARVSSCALRMAGAAVRATRGRVCVVSRQPLGARVPRGGGR